MNASEFLGFSMGIFCLVASLCVVVILVGSVIDWIRNDFFSKREKGDSGVEETESEVANG